MSQKKDEGREAFQAKAHAQFRWATRERYARRLGWASRHRLELPTDFGEHYWLRFGHVAAPFALVLALLFVLVGCSGDGDGDGDGGTTSTTEPVADPCVSWCLASADCPASPPNADCPWDCKVERTFVAAEGCEAYLEEWFTCLDALADPCAEALCSGAREVLDACLSPVDGSSQR